MSADTWRVVETRYDEGGQETRVVHHTHISGRPMDAVAAKALAAQEIALHAGGRLRRTFRAEPASTGRSPR